MEPLCRHALVALRGIRALRIDEQPKAKAKHPDPDNDEAYPASANDADLLKVHFAEIDALLDRAERVPAGETPLPKCRPHLVYDPDVREAENEDAWLDVVKRT
jgi:hypothetical protein